MPDDVNPSRCALVIGGSGHLGEAVVRLLAESGHRVAVHYRHNDVAAKEIAADIATGFAVGADVTVWSDVQAMVSRVNNDLGPIEIVVNCGAVRVDGLLVTQDIDEWRHVLDVNLVGAMHVIRATLPDMISLRWGRVVNVSSPVADFGNPGQSAYAASKAGLVAMTKSLAQEYGRRGITFNAISPGLMDSAIVSDLTAHQRSEIINRTAIQRTVGASEAALAVGLCIANAAITGAVIAVDGGMGAMS